MAGDEILMESSSALGPIDAQIQREGKVFSADALIEGMDKIKEEVQKTGKLNLAYVPILQALSPGELQSAENALRFARELVHGWLASYKFKNWSTHSSTNAPVTPEERRERANQIAAELCNHRKWLTHGRSIKLEDLRQMRLQITDYSGNPELADAIRRYHVLLQITFSSNIYKLFETPQSQIFRMMSVSVPPPPAGGAPGLDSPEQARIEFECPHCHTKATLQANLGVKQPIEAGLYPFPADNRFRCPKCQREHDLSEIKRNIEAQARRPVVG